MVAAHIITHAKYPKGRAIFYLEYTCLLFIVASTAAYSKKMIFHIPVIILCLISLSEIIRSDYDLRKPGVQEVLAETGHAPLYVLSHNPNVNLINHLSKINKDNIIQNYKPDEISALVNRDTSSTRYLLCAPLYPDSISFKVTKVHDCRDGLALYEVAK